MDFCHLSGELQESFSICSVGGGPRGPGPRARVDKPGWFAAGGRGYPEAEGPADFLKTRQVFASRGRGVSRSRSDSQQTPPPQNFRKRGRRGRGVYSAGGLGSGPHPQLPFSAPRALAGTVGFPQNLCQRTLAPYPCAETCGTVRWLEPWVCVSTPARERRHPRHGKTLGHSAAAQAHQHPRFFSDIHPVILPTPTSSWSADSPRRTGETGSRIAPA